MILRTSRRTDRIAVSIPIEAFGLDEEGAPFSELTHTLVVNRDGAAIALPRNLAPEQVITIRRGHPAKESDAKVVRIIGEQRDGTIYGIQLLGEASGFWDIDFPGATGENEAVGRVLLECESCHRQQVAHLGAIEAGVLEATRRISRTCRICEKLTVWTEPQGAPSAEGTEAAKRGAALEAFAKPAVVVPLSLDPLAAAPGEELPSRAEAARALGRAKVTLTACIRHPGLKDEIVSTESVGAGGVSFRSKRSYSAGERIEVATPYRAGQPAIFVPARIVRVAEKDADSGAEHFVAYVKTFVTVQEADGSFSIVERTAVAPSAARPAASRSATLKQALVPVAVSLGAIALLIMSVWRDGGAPNGRQGTAPNPVTAAASPSAPSASGAQPPGFGDPSPIGGGGSESDPDRTTADAPRINLDYQLDDGKLIVTGRADLPDGLPLEIDIYSGPILVATDAPVLVREDGFTSRPMLSRGDPFSPGKYRVRIQPAKQKTGGQPSGIAPADPFRFSADFELSE